MIDVDESGDLEKQEIVVAVKSNQVANAASYDRANFNLRGLRDLRNGTAVFVCLVCGGAGSSNDRFTLRSPPQKVIDFLKNCGEENLQFLLHPPRLDKALDALDTDKSGELDIEECTARRLFVSERFALLTARLLHRGSRHQPRPREAPGAAGRRARAPPARRGAGRRRIHARIFERGPRGLPNDRQGRLGNAR